jgi:tetratricopeptide (TPR) repeat protein
MIGLRAQARKAKDKGDLAQEVDAYRKMLALDPENQKVKNDLAAAEKKVPGQVDALYKQGVEYYAAGNLRAAIKSFQDVLALKPDHVKAKDAVANIKAKLVQTGQ